MKNEYTFTRLGPSWPRLHGQRGLPNAGAASWCPGSALQTRKTGAADATRALPWPCCQRSPRWLHSETRREAMAPAAGGGRRAAVHHAAAPRSASRPWGSSTVTVVTVLAKIVALPEEASSPLSSLADGEGVSLGTADKMEGFGDRKSWGG